MIIRDLNVRQLETEYYRELYPGIFQTPIPVITGVTLDEVRLRPGYSTISPREVNLDTVIGSLLLRLPLLPAAMDTVTGPDLAAAFAAMGGCGVIHRHRDPKVQLRWIAEALAHKFCLVRNPACLEPHQRIEDAQFILQQGFSTIPVIDERGRLLGVLFTKGTAFKDHLQDPVTKWMTPLSKLKTVSQKASFKEIRARLLNEPNCSALPLLGRGRKLEGVYFMKDVQYANPATHKGKPAVGMAISDYPDDLERLRQALDLGIALIVIDSSHGNCLPCITQAEAVVKLAQGQAAVIAGNVADINGYLALARTGVDGVKCGIGSGSICTTSTGTGVGVPMFTLIRELNYARKKLSIKLGDDAPVIIADGGIEGPGDAVIALAAGAHACMAGGWFVTARESHSYQQGDVHRDETGVEFVYYRGMGSTAAMEDRSIRYGEGKRAPEGIAGYKQVRGSLGSWLPVDCELIRGGFAHVGAANLAQLHKYAEKRWAFVQFTPAGLQQVATRLDKE